MNSGLLLKSWLSAMQITWIATEMIKINTSRFFVCLFVFPVNKCKSSLLNSTTGQRSACIQSYKKLGKKLWGVNYHSVGKKLKKNLLKSYHQVSEAKTLLQKQTPLITFKIKRPKEARWHPPKDLEEDKIWKIPHCWPEGLQKRHFTTDLP